MRAGLVVLLLGGCQTLFGIDRDPDKLVDAGDSMTGDARECWGTDIDICVRPPSTEPRMLMGTLDTGSQCDVVEDELCIVAGTDVTIGNVRVFGPRPLVVVASGKLTVTGPLDAASHSTGANQNGPGVGATAAMCSAFAAAPTFNQTGGNGGGASGGAGGTFVNAGGNGGASVGGAAIGQASATVAAAFRTGCAGQNGGTRATLAAAGGKGGGAVYLLSSSQIEISGAINASGASGDSGKCVNCAPTNPTTTELQNADAYGGGGGGSGGAIILEAPAIAITATGRVFADGGGGGQGASRSSPGEVGAEPTGAAAAFGGRGADDGGTGPNNGGNGGPGSFAVAKTGVIGAAGESSNPGGGGGGGGGGGYVKTIGTLTNMGAISPAP